MKKYNLGNMEVKNVDVLKKALKEFNEDFVMVGVQRSLACFEKFSYENVTDIIKNGFKETYEKENETINALEHCEFKLPLFNKQGYVKADALIVGNWNEIITPSNTKQEFIIKGVKIISTEE